MGTPAPPTLSAQVSASEPRRSHRGAAHGAATARCPSATLPGRDRPQNEAQFSVVLGPRDPRFLRCSCRGRRPEEETLRLGARGEAPARSACPGSPERGQDLRVWDGAGGLFASCARGAAGPAGLPPGAARAPSCPRAVPSLRIARLAFQEHRFLSNFSVTRDDHRFRLFTHSQLYIFSAVSRMGLEATVGESAGPALFPFSHVWTIRLGEMK